nr:ribonuclease H-like domain-containing protein [Tanacetum cinerariifolium]
VVPKSKLVPINAARPITADVSKINMTRPRQDKPIVTKPNLPPKRHINHNPSPKASNYTPKVTAVKALMVNVAKMCDKKNSVLFTDTECLVLSSEFKLPDENQVLLRVLRENNMYNNTDGDVAFDEKEPEFKGRKPKSEVNVSPSSSVQSKKHDDKTKREAKGKSPIESLTGYRNLSAEVEDFSNNSITEDTPAGSLVPAVGQLSSNNTNTFSAAGPSNATVSPTHGKSLYVDSS